MLVEKLHETSQRQDVASTWRRIAEAPTLQVDTPDAFLVVYLKTESPDLLVFPWSREYTVHEILPLRDSGFVSGTLRSAINVRPHLYDIDILPDLISTFWGDDSRELPRLSDPPEEEQIELLGYLALGLLSQIGVMQGRQRDAFLSFDRMLQRHSDSIDALLDRLSRLVSIN